MIFCELRDRIIEGKKRNDVLRPPNRYMSEASEFPDSVQIS